jgi:hypothetical protein
LRRLCNEGRARDRVRADFAPVLWLLENGRRVDLSMKREEQSMVAERLLANLKELVALGRELEAELAPKPSWIKRVLNRISKMRTKTKRKETKNT